MTLSTGGHERSLLVVIALAAVCAGWVSAAPQAPRDVDLLMARVGERVAEYYRRAQRVMCIEESTVQPIASNWSLEGMARTVESELRVESDGSDGDTLPEARVLREIRRINGREPRERDKKDRSGCTDPNPLSPEPLAFLLPGHREDYQFTSVREGREKDRDALIVDFRSVVRATHAELIEDGAATTTASIGRARLPREDASGLMRARTTSCGWIAPWSVRWICASRGICSGAITSTDG